MMDEVDEKSRLIFCSTAEHLKSGRFWDWRKRPSDTLLRLPPTFSRTLVLTNKFLSHVRGETWARIQADNSKHSHAAFTNVQNYRFVTRRSLFISLCGCLCVHRDNTHSPFQGPVFKIETKTPGYSVKLLFFCFLFLNKKRMLMGLFACIFY